MTPLREIVYGSRREYKKDLQICCPQSPKLLRG